MEKSTAIEVFQVPATLSGATILAHATLKLIFRTQESLNSESMKRMCELHEKTGWLSFNVEKIEAVNIVNLPKIRQADYEGKSPSQTQRSLLWVLWEKKGKPGIFEDFYIRSMGRFHQQIRDEIDKYDSGAA